MVWIGSECRSDDLAPRSTTVAAWSTSAGAISAPRPTNPPGAACAAHDLATHSRCSIAHRSLHERVVSRAGHGGRPLGPAPERGIAACASRCPTARSPVRSRVPIPPCRHRHRRAARRVELGECGQDLAIGLGPDRQRLRRRAQRLGQQLSAVPLRDRHTSSPAHGEVMGDPPQPAADVVRDATCADLDNEAQKRLLGDVFGRCRVVCQCRETTPKRGVVLGVCPARRSRRRRSCRGLAAVHTCFRHDHRPVLRISIGRGRPELDSGPMPAPLGRRQARAEGVGDTGDLGTIKFEGADDVPATIAVANSRLGDPRSSLARHLDCHVAHPMPLRSGRWQHLATQPLRRSRGATAVDGSRSSRVHGVEWSADDSA